MPIYALFSLTAARDSGGRAFRSAASIIPTFSNRVYISVKAGPTGVIMDCIRSKKQAIIGDNHRNYTLLMQFPGEFQSF